MRARASREQPAAHPPWQQQPRRWISGGEGGGAPAPAAGEVHAPLAGRASSAGLRIGGQTSPYLAGWLERYNGTTLSHPHVYSRARAPSMRSRLCAAGGGTARRWAEQRARLR
eukprot:365408-Chlamydomonas_euryale.AAC.15